MKNEDQEVKEKEKIIEFLKAFTGEKEVLETFDVGVSIEISKITVPEDIIGRPAEMLCVYMRLLDEWDSISIPCFYLNQPDYYATHVCDHIYLTLYEAFRAYGRDIVRDSFSQAVEEITGKYPREQVKIEDQIYGKPIDKTFIRRDLRGGKPPKANLDELLTTYEEKFEQWKEIFRIYQEGITSTSVERRKSWRGDIKRFFSDFPEDLIVRVQSCDEIPPEIADRIEKEGSNVTPEDLALLHAARLCGAKPTDYTVSTLRRKLNRQRQKSQPKK